MPILYPSLNHLGIIGDRRTAGMVSADGTLCWFCLPNYNGGPVFGSLLDSERGGHWRLGPKWLDSGVQSYRDDSAVLVTRWVEGGDELEVTDFMPWPENRRPSEQESSRTIIRRAHAVSGTVECNMELVAKKSGVFGKHAADFLAGRVHSCGNGAGQGKAPEQGGSDGGNG